MPKQLDAFALPTKDDQRAVEHETELLGHVRTCRLLDSVSSSAACVGMPMFLPATTDTIASNSDFLVGPSALAIRPGFKGPEC